MLKSFHHFIGLEFEPTNAALLQGQSEVNNALMQQVLGQQTPMDVDPSSPSTPTASSAPPKQTQPQKAPPSADDNLPENKKAAKAEKELGNGAYKKKDFENALSEFIFCH